MRRAVITSLIVAFLCIISLSGASIAQPAQVVAKERTMFKKMLPDGSSIVIYGSQAKPDGFVNVLDDADAKELAAFLSYRAELYPPAGAPPVIIWTALERCNKGWAGQDNSEVLDVGCGGNCFVLVLWSGGQLWVYYHDFSGLPTSGVISIPTDWTIFPTYHPFDPAVTKASLEIEKDHVWKLHVIEHDDQVGRITDFEKTKDKWEFTVGNSTKMEK